MDNPRRRLLRLPEYDYSQPGSYFVTVCARDRQCLFGRIVEGAMRPSRVGEAVSACWDEIPRHHPNVVLDAFVLMPNHVHGILMLTDDVGAGHARPLPVIVGSFKSAVSRRIGAPIWQRNYWEHVIRNEDEANRIRHYIDGNPLHWAADRENPAWCARMKS